MQRPSTPFSMLQCLCLPVHVVCDSLGGDQACVVAEEQRNGKTDHCRWIVRLFSLNDGTEQKQQQIDVEEMAAQAGDPPVATSRLSLFMQYVRDLQLAEA